MLVRFSIENYLSFKNLVVLDMQAGTIKEHSQHVYTPFFERNVKLLKGAAIYGANSMGKSNLIKAFSFMRALVLNSSKESNTGVKIDVEPFLLSTTTEFKPSMFEVVFYLNDYRYKYGFTVSKLRVESEWLAITVKNKEESIFLRHGSDFNIEKKFKNELKTQLDLLTKFTRDNSLFISILSQFNIDIGKAIINWFDSTLVALDTEHSYLFQTSANLFKDIKYRQLLNDIIQHSGLGIESIEERLSSSAERTGLDRNMLNAIFKREIENLTIKARHIKYDENNKPVDNVYFDMIQQESLGTQKYFALLGPILIALHEKRVFFVDELDSRLHPLLFEIIVDFFNSNKYNASGAQIIFTAHDTNLLKKNLRRDQMIFVNKDEYGVTSLASLYHLKPHTRNDASFEKDYLKGLYGAIPSIQTQQLRLF